MCHVWLLGQKVLLLLAIAKCFSPLKDKSSVTLALARPTHIIFCGTAEKRVLGGLLIMKFGEFFKFQVCDQFSFAVVFPRDTRP